MVLPSEFVLINCHVLLNVDFIQVLLADIQQRHFSQSWKRSAEMVLGLAAGSPSGSWLADGRYLQVVNLASTGELAHCCR